MLSVLRYTVYCNIVALFMRPIGGASRATWFGVIPAKGLVPGDVWVQVEQRVQTPAAGVRETVAAEDVGHVVDGQLLFVGLHGVNAGRWRWHKQR